MSNLTIVVPCYNEVAAIEQVISDLLGYFTLDQILVVDDGSIDDTLSVAASQGVRVVRHDHNAGYGAAIKTGLRRTKTEFVALFDGDGQHAAQDLATLWAGFDGEDMIVGARSADSDQPFIRRPGKWLLKKVAEQLCGRKIPDLNSGMRIVNRKLLVGYSNILPNGFSLSTTSTIAFHRDGHLVRYAPITTRARVGKSTVNILTDGVRVLLKIFQVIAIFSPMRIFFPAMCVQLFLASMSFAENLRFQGGNISDGTVLFSLSAMMTFLMGLVAEQLAHIRKEIGKK